MHLYVIEDALQVSELILHPAESRRKIQIEKCRGGTTTFFSLRFGISNPIFRKKHVKKPIEN